MGGGGTGKSVLTATLHQRVSEQVVAWHYCRHDHPKASAPAALLRSLATMLCHRLPGYADALAEVPSETVTDPEELFAALFAVPLKVVTEPGQRQLIIIDALDELPKETQKPLLAVIAGQFSQLPAWLKLFVTSREEPQIKQALDRFSPTELRADEAKNKADVEIFLRTIARKHVKGQLSMADIEADVQRKFGIDMDGKMAELQEPMNRSLEIYETARTTLRALDGYSELLAVEDQRPDPTQESNEFDTVYAQAREAQEVLTTKIASEWAVDTSRPLGAKWKEVGQRKPGAGIEIHNLQLAATLRHKKQRGADLELTQEELRELSVTDLQLGSFIEVHLQSEANADREIVMYMEVSAV
jgi:hypothetical protein